MYPETIVAIGAVGVALVYVLHQKYEVHKMHQLLADIGLGKVRVTTDEKTKTITIKQLGE